MLQIINGLAKCSRLSRLEVSVCCRAEKKEEKSGSAVYVLVTAPLRFCLKFTILRLFHPNTISFERFTSSKEKEPLQT